VAACGWKASSPTNVDRALAYSIASMFQTFAVKNSLRTEEEVKKELAGL
jgi:hypothetical protein